MKACGKTILVVSTILLLSTISTIGPALAKPEIKKETGSLAGYVLDGKTKKPINQAKIQLFKIEDRKNIFSLIRLIRKIDNHDKDPEQPAYQTETNKEGFYLIKNIETGVYLIYSSAEGYLSSMNIIRIRANTCMLLNLYLMDTTPGLSNI